MVWILKQASLHELSQLSAAQAHLRLSLIVGNTGADMVLMTIKRGTCVVMGLPAVFVDNDCPGTARSIEI